MPNLNDVDLNNAFRYKDNVTIIGGCYFIPLSRIDIGDLQRFFPPPSFEECWSSSPIPVNTVELVIGNYKCNDYDITELNLTKYRDLKSVTIGGNSFSYVSELKIVGMEKLESVEIGMNSFTKEKYYYGNDPNRHFYLKDCPKLKSLEVGAYSFSDYSVIEIESVDALEVIKIGDLDYWSNNFYHASLELKSILIHSK